MMNETTAIINDVAVLIPVYNCRNDLERTLASISEMVVVYVLVIDDGSVPPITPCEHAALTIEVLRMPCNIGVEHTCAIGIDALAAHRFRYVATVDAGDLVVPQRLAKQRAFLARYPRIACIGTWAK